MSLKSVIVFATAFLGCTMLLQVAPSCTMFVCYNAPQLPLCGTVNSGPRAVGAVQGRGDKRASEKKKGLEEFGRAGL